MRGLFVLALACGVSAESSQRLFDTLKDRFAGAAPCAFEGVSTKESHVEIEWSVHGKMAPPIRLTPACGAAQPTVEVPPEFSAQCSGSWGIVEEIRSFAMHKPDVTSAPRPSGQITESSRRVLDRIFLVLTAVEAVLAVLTLIHFLILKRPAFATRASLSIDTPFRRVARFGSSCVHWIKWWFVTIRGVAARYRTWPAAAHLLMPLLVGFVWTLLCSPGGLPALAENSLLRALLIGMAWALFVGRDALRQQVAPPTRLDAALLAVIVALGAALRFALTPEPYHSDNWMEWLVLRVARDPDPAKYANGYPIFMRLFLFTGDPERAVFVGNRVAGLLSPLAMYAAVRSLFRDPRHALWAALLLAIQPMHVRFSASESMQILPLFFSVVALIGFRGHARLGSRPLLALGICAFTYAVLTRPDASTMAVALPLVYAPREDRARLRDGWLYGGVALAIVFGLPMLIAGAWYAHLAQLTSADWVTVTLAEALKAAGPPHSLLVIAAAIGFILMAVEGTGGALLVLIAFIARVAVTGYERDPGNELQLLCADVPWLVLATAAVPAAIERAFRRWQPARTFAAIGMAVAALALSVRAPIMHLTWDVHQEWDFIEHSAPAAAAAAPQMPLVRGLSGFATATLPQYKFPGRVVGTVDDLLAGKLKLPALYYRGLDCYRSGGGEGYLKGPLSRTCAAAEARFHATRLSSAVVDAPDYAGHKARPMEIGFFVLEPPGH